MNGIWVSGDIPRLVGPMRSCSTPAATRPDVVRPGCLERRRSDVQRTDRAVRLAGAYQGRPICERKLTSEGSVHGPSLLVRHPASARSSRAR